MASPGEFHIRLNIENLPDSAAIQQIADSLIDMGQAANHLVIALKAIEENNKENKDA